MLTTALAVALVQQVLPAGPLTAGGLADPREPRVAIGWISTNLLASPLRAREGQGFPPGTDLKHDRQGVIQLGTDMPLLGVRGFVLALQGGMTSRFRLEAKDNDLLTTDYMIALPLNYTRGRYSARVRVLHRSSHLGDELMQNTTIRRLEFTHNETDLLIARQFHGWRAYAGGTATLSSYFPNDRHGFQAGADGQWRVGAQLWVLAGIDGQTHTLTQGAHALGMVAGIEARGRAGRAALVGQYFDGASPLGEFFLQREHFWGLSLRLSRSGGTGNPAVPI